jgi:hypothetical protein
MRHIKARSIESKLAAAVSALILAGALLAATTGPSMATRAVAKKTGKDCTVCHTNPPEKDLTAEGKKYKASQQ